jgi:hypothetical protein
MLEIVDLPPRAENRFAGFLARTGGWGNWSPPQYRTNVLVMSLWPRHSDRRPTPRRSLAKEAGVAE